MAAGLPVSGPAPTPRPIRPCHVLWTRLVWHLALGVLLPWLPMPGLAQQRPTPAGTAAWETLAACRLLSDKTRDGDSFHVLHQGREYVFRLYSVDAPETETSYPDRVRDQAQHFGLPPSAIPPLGTVAGEFTARRLRREFTVVTRWENALGRGLLPRFYAVVLVGRTNLATELVRHGLARVHGRHADWPDAGGRRRFLSELRRAEAEARRHRRGGFHPSAVAPAQPTPVRIDLNSATSHQLQSLPGIGPKLAQRILDARPFRSVSDLRKVPGIGPKTFASLTNRVLVIPRARRP